MTNKEQYRSFCAEEKSIPLFLKSWWLDALCDDWDVAIVKNGDKISGVWPYRLENKLGVTLLRNQPLTPYLGPYVIYPPDLKESKRDNFQHETISALLDQLPDAKYMHISAFPGMKQLGLFNKAGIDVNVRQTFLMSLHERIDTLFDKLNENYRRNIRKTEIEIDIEDEPEQIKKLWEFQKATLDRKDVSMHFSEELLIRLFEACVIEHCAALWVARKDGEIKAILWHVWDDQCAYYLVGGKNPTTKDNRSMTALIWHAITESKVMDKKVFDFEGSMDPGVEKFFRNFGAERELYMVLQKNTSLLWKIKERIL